MQDLTVSILQTNLFWQDTLSNLGMLEEKLKQISSDTDLIVLPEMFSTGFSMEAENLAEEMDGETVNWMKRMAEKQQAVLTGSIIIHDKGRYFNRLLWVRPDQSVDFYDKKHLFRMAGETSVYSPGSQHLSVTLNGWKICPLICYDLRFPVWSRNTEDGYDLLLYVANWPEARSNAWRVLLQARSIENLAYTVGVNRVGNDGNDISHSGDSMVIDPKGNILVHLAQHESHHTLTLRMQELKDFRKKFPALMDMDLFDFRNPAE